MFKPLLTTSKNDAGKDGFFLLQRTLTKDYPIHLHEVFELEYIYEGEATVKINNNVCSAAAGDLLFCTPLDVQEVLLKSDHLKLINICFTEEYIDPALIHRISNGFISKDFPKSFIDLLYNEENDLQPDSFIYLKSVISIILLTILRENKNAVTVSSNDLNSNIAQNIILFIKMHYKQQITLNDIAKSLSYSPVYIGNVFRKAFGVTITQYISTFRLEQALQLLLHTNLSITDVCFESGFQSVSTFFRVFKQQYGVSPKEIRKNRSNDRDDFFYKI